MCERQRERECAVLNVRDDEVGQSGSAAAITAVFARHHHQLLTSTAQFMLRWSLSDCAVSQRNKKLHSRVIFSNIFFPPTSGAKECVPSNQRIIMDSVVWNRFCLSGQNRIRLAVDVCPVQ